jgi:hypothetical protein
MIQSFTKIATLLFTLASALVLADCCQSYELGVGWRRDNLHWKMSEVDDFSCGDSSATGYAAESDFNFKNIHIYTISGKARFVDHSYFIRLSGEYGISEKGRAQEEFSIFTPFFSGSTCVSNHVKRRSEFFDFSGATGYPFTFNDGCGYITPLIGFSFHRQRIRVKDDEMIIDGFSDDVVDAVGFFPTGETSNYRFTWYGPFVGFDAAYSLSPLWTLYGEFEWHFLDRCNRKRDSNVGLEFVDEYHHKGYAYGFNSTIGATAVIGACWFSSFNIDFKYWNSDNHHDHLKWLSVGANVRIGYMY